MPLAMTQKFTIIELISHMFIICNALCMFPGRGGHLSRPQGPHRQPGIRDAQLVVRAAGPLVSKGLMCKLTLLRFLQRSPAE